MLTTTKGPYSQFILYVHADGLIREGDHADVESAEDTAMTDLPSGNAFHDLRIAVA